MSAEKVTDSIEPDTAAVIEKALEAELSKYGLDSLGKSWGPAETLRKHLPR